MELQFAEQASSASERMSQNAGGILIIQIILSTQMFFIVPIVSYCPCVMVWGEDPVPSQEVRGQYSRSPAEVGNDRNRSWLRAGYDGYDPHGSFLSFPRCGCYVTTSLELFDELCHNPLSLKSKEIDGNSGYSKVSASCSKLQSPTWLGSNQWHEALKWSEQPKLRGSALILFRNLILRCFQKLDAFSALQDHSLWDFWMPDMPLICLIYVRPWTCRADEVILNFRANCFGWLGRGQTWHRSCSVCGVSHHRFERTPRTASPCGKCWRLWYHQRLASLGSSYT